MKSFKNYQNVRIITAEGTIADGDYILDDVTIRCERGLLNDAKSEDGGLLPAIETSDGGHVEHWRSGRLHCEYEPAVIDQADKYEEWYFDGERVEPKNA